MHEAKWSYLLYIFYFYGRTSLRDNVYGSRSRDNKIHDFDLKLCYVKQKLYNGVSVKMGFSRIPIV
jgi:hypothetical protein